MAAASGIGPERGSPLSSTLVRPMEHASAQLSELMVRGYRRLREVTLPLTPLSVLIGANGSGKTSLLEVFSLLASSAEGKLGPALSELSGLSSLLTYDRASALQLTLGAGGASAVRYSLRLCLKGIGYTIAEERLFGVDGAFFENFGEAGVEFGEYGVPFHHGLSETALSQVPKSMKVAEDFRRRLASLAHYHVLGVGPRSPVRLPQAISPAMLPGRVGEDLVSCLFYLRETDRARFEAIEDTLRAAFPRFDRLEFPPVAAGTIALAWRERGLSKPFYTHQLSQGTLRFLWLTTLLQSPGLTALTLIDEPEASLHPELLSILADQLREASGRTQLIVATQSDTLVRFLHPAEVVVLDAAEDGMTTATRADKLDLDEWLEDYSLDELWRNGRLGARP